MVQAMFAYPAGTFSTNRLVVEETPLKYVVYVDKHGTFNQYGIWTVTMYRPTQVAPTTHKFDWEITYSSAPDTGIQPILFSFVYNGFQGQGDVRITADSSFRGTTQKGTAVFDVTYSGYTGPLVVDPAWFVQIGFGDPSSGNATYPVSFQHPANSGAYPLAVAALDLSSKCCEPIPDSVHVYLNGVEQYQDVDWVLMPPDATHTCWWIRSINENMLAAPNDLLEARYVCKPGS